MGGGHGAEPRVRRTFGEFLWRKNSFSVPLRPETDWQEATKRSPKYNTPWLRRAPLVHPLALKQIGGEGHKAEPRVRRAKASEGSFGAPSRPEINWGVPQSGSPPPWGRGNFTLYVLRGDSFLLRRYYAGDPVLKISNV